LIYDDNVKDGENVEMVRVYRERIGPKLKWLLFRVSGIAASIWGAINRTKLNKAISYGGASVVSVALIITAGALFSSTEPSLVGAYSVGDFVELDGSKYITPKFNGHCKLPKQLVTEFNSKKPSGATKSNFCASYGTVKFTYMGIPMGKGTLRVFCLDHRATRSPRGNIPSGTKFMYGGSSGKHHYFYYKLPSPGGSIQPAFVWIDTTDEFDQIQPVATSKIAEPITYYGQPIVDDIDILVTEGVGRIIDKNDKKAQAVWPNAVEGSDGSDDSSGNIWTTSETFSIGEDNTATILKISLWPESLEDPPLEILVGDIVIDARGTVGTVQIVDTDTVTIRIDSNDDDDDDGANGFEPLTFCLYALGPFQQPQTYNVPNGTDSQLYFNSNAKMGKYGNSVSDATWSGASNGTNVMHKCVSTGIMDKIGVCDKDAFQGGCSGDSFKVELSDSSWSSKTWAPGYYYFAVMIDGQSREDVCYVGSVIIEPSESDNIDITDDEALGKWCRSQGGEVKPKRDSSGEVTGQSQALSEVMIFNGEEYDGLEGKYWFSRFIDDNEKAIRGFQPFATSVSDNNGIVDKDHRIAKDILTVYATTSPQEAKNYENTGTGDVSESYWLKDDKGEHIPVEFCVSAYGPYQMPQQTSPSPQGNTLNVPDPGGHTPVGNKICKDLSPSSSLDERTIAFDSSVFWTPGYYYYITSVTKATQDESRDSINDDWISNFNPSTLGQREYSVVPFQPYATSTVANGDGDGLTYVHTGDTIHDVLNIKTADYIENANNGIEAPYSHWLKNNDGKYIPINFCVTAYGPYNQPQDPIVNASGSGIREFSSGILTGTPADSYAGFSYSTSAKKATICHTATNGPETEDIVYSFKADNWTPGYYYFLTTVNKTNGEYSGYFGPIAPGSSDQNNSGIIGGFSNPVTRPPPDTKINDLMIGGWISGFNPNDTVEGDGSDEDEWGMVQFQPFVTSEVPVIWVKDGVASITDKLTSHAAKDLAGAEDGYQAADDLKAYWPKDRRGNYEEATICVTPYGPYQNAQANGTVNGTSQYVIPNDDGRQVKPAAKALCLAFNGPEETMDYRFDTFGWEPGYYYFMSYFRKGSVQSTDPDGVMHNGNRPVFYGDWVSKFNPSTEKEAVVDKFQLKAASKTRSANFDNNPMTVSTGIPADTASNNSAGHVPDLPDGIVDGQDSGSAVTVLKPTDDYIEDSIYIRAYDTYDQTDITDRNEYWLKDRSNKFITFRVCVNIYGPYQRPQPRALANNLIGSPTSAGTSVDNNYLTNNKNPMAGREQCFWTDTLQGQASGSGTLTLGASVNNGLVAKPTASGGPGEYKVRWSNKDDDYFLPGYYYMVWNVDTNTTSETNSDSDPASTGTCNGNANNCTTTVDLGSGRITRRNGDFLVSDWYSPFGEQSESFYAQFQPIARSTIPEFAADNPTDGESGRTKSEGNEGIIMECDENKYSNLVNFVDNPEEFPHEMLNCQKITDNIYLGAINDKSIIGTSVYANTDDRYWPKNKDGLWEVVKFQVKLYGPFKDADFDKTTIDPVVGSAGGVTISTIPANVYAAQSIYAQPIAESCVITTNPAIQNLDSTMPNGPNWNKDEKPYEAIFTQNFGSCYGNTPYNTTIKLPPGIYTSVVEIVRDDEQNWDKTKCLYNANCNLDGTSTQITTSPHNMLIKDRFTSVWGDPKETLMVPIPLYITTRRDNSGQNTFETYEEEEVVINDKYWIHGFTSEYVNEDGERVPWQDIYGNNIPKYGDYAGDDGYFNADIKGQAVTVNLYGPYSLETGMPNENGEYCLSNQLTDHGRWILPAEDTPKPTKDKPDGGLELPYPAPLKLREKGWYVWQYNFNGGERISNIKTQCGDTSEMFRIIRAQIGLETAARSDDKTAPTRITDTVTITGKFTNEDKDSIVKLSLYKSARGREVRPGETGLDGPPICTVIFTVSSSGTYGTEKYIDADGYVLDKTLGSGRCFAEEGGHYYWLEQFLRPKSDILNPTESDFIQPPRHGEAPEDIDILPPTTPKVSTDADPVATVGQAFRDTALIEDMPKGNTKPYYLYFTAYGPYADGQINCSDNLIYSNQSDPITVMDNGEYFSGYVTVAMNGLVYWVEHLVDEMGDVVDEGVCGIERETTYVVGPMSPGDSFDPFSINMASLPLYPDAGYLTRQIGKIIAFGSVSILGAWQLTNRRSWLLRRR
jgi:hypothetical protein